MIKRGEVRWVDFPAPKGSEPGFRRPAVIVQADIFNASRIGTTLVVPFTSKMHRAGSPGNVLVSKRQSGLPRDSVANVAHLRVIDRTLIGKRTGELPNDLIGEIERGLRLVLGL